MQATIQKIVEPEQSSFVYRSKSNLQWPFKWHFHPEYELTLVTQGRGRRFVGDSISDYADGDLVLIGPNLPHTWHSMPAKKRGSRQMARVIQFREDCLGTTFFDCADMRSVKSLLNRCSDGIAFSGKTRSEATRKIIELGRYTGVKRLTTFLHILGLLANSNSAKQLSSPGFVPLPHDENHRRIDTVCQFLTENYTLEISQAEVAELIGMSPSIFSGFFKRSVGSTFRQFVNRLRISHACHLLIETDQQILEISHRSGFNNLSNFNRRFLQIKKMSPRAYRSHFAPTS
jgi:AraC-like DNA-binding protein